MTVASLVSQFSKIDSLPVEIDAVIEAMRSDFGVTDEIYYFWDEQLNPKSIRGYILREEIPREGTTYMRSTISYGRMGEEMERLVCGKELTHILDPEGAKVSSADEIAALIRKIVLPPELVDPFNDGHHANSDRAGIAKALALLFPYSAREILLPAFREGKMSARMIAELAELPPYYVNWVLSDGWQQIHDIIVG